MEKTLNIPLGSTGKVRRGTFTTTINGNRVFTPTGIYYLVEAFLIEASLEKQVMNAHMEFSDETKEILAERYGLGSRPMITGDVGLSGRINDDNDNMSLEMRNNAYPIYEMFKSKGW